MSQQTARPKRNTQASLEGLPVEIRYEILYSITDPSTLRSLVHACPLYHCLYTQQPTEIWWKMAFKTMAERDLALLAEPSDCIHINLQNNAPLESPQRELLEEFCRSMQNDLPFHMSIPMSQAIIQVADLLCWKAKISDYGQIALTCSRCPLKDYPKDARALLKVLVHRGLGARSGPLAAEIRKTLFLNGPENYHVLWEGDRDTVYSGFNIAERFRTLPDDGLVFTFEKMGEGDSKQA